MKLLFCSLMKCLMQKEASTHTYIHNLVSKTQEIPFYSGKYVIRMYHLQSCFKMIKGD